MKCTWPTPAPHVGDPAPPISHLLVLGVGIGGNANFSVFKYQHVGIAKANFRVGGADQTRSTNTSSFASQWNIGLMLFHAVYCLKYANSEDFTVT